MHGCAGIYVGQRWMSGVFLSCSPSYCFERGSLTESGILWFCKTDCWVSLMDLPGSIILVLELQSHTSAPNLCVGLGNPTWVLMLALTESALHSQIPATMKFLFIFVLECIDRTWVTLYQAPLLSFYFLLLPCSCIPSWKRGNRMCYSYLCQQ